MPPKGKKAPGAAKASSTAKQIDDFIGESELQDGEEKQQLSMSLKAERVKELDEKFYAAKNPIILGSNLRSLVAVRTLTTIFTGLAAGVIGMNGLEGVIFYALVDVIVGIVLALRFGFKAEPYFQSLYQVIMTGFASNVMTFMVSWIFVHNIVYVL